MRRREPALASVLALRCSRSPRPGSVEARSPNTDIDGPSKLLPVTTTGLR